MRMYDITCAQYAWKINSGVVNEHSHESSERVYFNVMSDDTAIVASCKGSSNKKIAGFYTQIKLIGLKR